ncbi:MAG: nuclear transport factor 2 family protein [Pseudohongiellaceae bacterium]|nr:nuclear transport factor 2 family protein [Pseudohongiellaceae bacterium]
MKRLVATIALFLSFIPAAFSAEDVYRACSNLVYGYAYHRDNFNAEEFSNLFTEDASLSVLGQNWVGRDNIRARIDSIREGNTGRHEMSTIFIEPIDDTHATGVSYATIYSAPPGENTVSGPAFIGEYHDEFVLTEEGWKIAKRTLKRRYILE